ncbi:MAG: recombinase family protein [Blautia sp.]|nr:recombinase family protein [Blautia sp.]
MSKGNRAVFYARVSTEEENQLKALPKQVQECKDTIKEKGWILIDGYIDEGKSGTTSKRRDEYRRLFDDLEKDTFDIIVIKSQDRLMRNVKDWYIFLDRMITNGKQLYIYLDGGFYTSDNALITGIKAILAEEFSRDLSKKLNNANRRRVEKAKNGEEFTVMGSPQMYGYTMRDGEWVIDEKEAEVVRLIYEKYLETDSARKTMEYLNQNGYRNRVGRPYNTDTILRILKNERNKGTVVLNRHHRDFNLKKIVINPEEEWVIVEDATPAIVSKDVWETVNNNIKAKAIRHDGRGKKVGKEKLSGKLYCASCGSVMWGHTQKYKDKPYMYWKCSAQKAKGTIACADGVTISENKVREIIRGLTSDLQPHRAVIRESWVNWLGEIRKGLTGQNRSPERQKKDLHILEEKKERLTDAYIDGLIPKGDYVKRLKEIEAQIENYEIELQVTQNEDVKEIDYYLENIDTELDKWMDSLAFEESKIDFILEHTKKITVTKDKHMIIELDLIAGVIIAGEDFLLFVKEQGHVLGHKEDRAVKRTLPAAADVFTGQLRGLSGLRPCRNQGLHF